MIQILARVGLCYTLVVSTTFVMHAMLFPKMYIFSLYPTLPAPFAKRLPLCCYRGPWWLNIAKTNVVSDIDLTLGKRTVTRLRNRVIWDPKLSVATEDGFVVTLLGKGFYFYDFYLDDEELDNVHKLFYVCAKCAFIAVLLYVGKELLFSEEVMRCLMS